MIIHVLATPWCLCPLEWEKLIRFESLAKSEPNWLDCERTVNQNCAAHHIGINGIRLSIVQAKKNDTMHSVGLGA
jgi:hypothetical protein